MSSENIKKIIKEMNASAIIVKDFDEALIGTGRICGKNPVSVYDTNKILEILMEKNSIGDLEAYELFQRTMIDAFPDANDPVFINDFRKTIDIQDIPGMSLDDTIEKLGL